MNNPKPIVDPKVYDVPVDALVEYPGNPRTSDVDGIARSLQINGQFRPILVRRETREILGGNHTWKAAKQLGWDTIQATYIEGVTDAQAARIVLADNRYSDLASYSVPDLTALLDSLPTLEGTGCDTYELVNLDAAFSGPVSPSEPLAAPAPQQARETPSQILTGQDVMAQPRAITCPNCDHTWET